MAVIKAGTYRFNDVLSVPSADVAYTVSSPEEVIYFDSIVTDDDGGVHELRLAVTVIGTDGLATVKYYVAAVYEDGEKIDIQQAVEVYADTRWATEYDGIPFGFQTITIPNDSEVSAEFYEWFTANAVEQKQISGAWKFKDTVSFDGIDAFWVFLNFTLSGVLVVDYETYSVTFDEDAVLNCTDLTVIEDGDDDRIVYAQQGDYFLPDVIYNNTDKWDATYQYCKRAGLDIPEVKGYGQTIDFGTEPQTVSAEFYNWLTENATQPTASIQYNGSAITSLFPGQTATLKCKGMKMEDDVVVAVAESVGGSCDGDHVIEVDELPTEDIDEGAVYSCGGKYYKWVNEFADLIIYDGGAMSYKEMASQLGLTLTFNTIPTKTTDGILESDMQTTMHCYYIEDEADVFIYMGEWSALSDMGLVNGGVISDISEATTDGCYYALIGVWKGYSEAPSGAMNVTENGTYDVTDKESVAVNVPTLIMVQTVADLPTDAPNGTTAIVLGVE